MSPSWEELRREGHGAGGHTADVCLVGAAGEIANQLSCRLLALEDRRHHGDVRQVGAAQIGIVEDNKVAGDEGCLLPRHAHRLRHRAQVNGDMRRLGHQPAIVVKERAGSSPDAP